MLTWNMPISLEQVRGRLNRRLSETRKKYITVKRNLARRVLLDVLESTPVDTSKLVSNWQVSLGFASAPVIEAHSEGKAGSTAGESIAKAYSEGDGVIRLARKEKEDIHISNNVPYLKFNLDRINLEGEVRDKIRVSGDFGDE